MILSSLIALALAPAQATCVRSPQDGHTGAARLSWYINDEAVTVDRKKFVKYGLPRVLEPGDVDLHAPYGNGYFYREKGTHMPDLLYLLIDLKDCEFQPYQVAQ
ncbi:MAG: hypothetical protein KF730_05220 [Sphingomonas sp.]|uniref:hypothetical protein n=1 Tax=Sphingomonas sp. TaxID=28214 RepID=UPI0025CDE362|nr:hypothetical protein [Sphingomonas sp.]MBX3563963.1 hypothetical protein [Sphingomonas sp.]